LKLLAVFDAVQHQAQQLGGTLEARRRLIRRMAVYRTQLFNA
jgi:hypothetical protein